MGARYPIETGQFSKELENKDDPEADKTKTDLKEEPKDMISNSCSDQWLLFGIFRKSPDVSSNPMLTPKGSKQVPPNLYWVNKWHLFKIFSDFKLMVTFSKRVQLDIFMNIKILFNVCFLGVTPMVSVWLISYQTWLEVLKSCGLSKDQRFVSAQMRNIMQPRN